MPKAPMTREEIENTRGRILDTALDIIIMEGFQNLSVRKIASRLGVTATTIYNYYTNKDEINLMIRIRGFEKLYDMLTKSSDPLKKIEDRFKAMVRAYVEFGLTYPFMPTEFTQVNPHINQVLVRRSMALLDPQPGERIADFFCGLGNFTLPIACRGAQVLGLEGSVSLVRRARQNAERNGLENQTEFREADLFEITAEELAALGRFDKWLVDPPRDGALELIKAIPDEGKDRPKRIVYISCNPATLARDAGVLVQVKGYRLTACGVVNMFPHTAHVESIAVFEN